MLRCKNCGGNLIFNIAGQDVECVFCGSHFSPEDYADDRPAEEYPKFDAQTGEPLADAEDGTPKFDAQTGEPLKPEIKRQDAAGDNMYYETVVHTCTQCGAQIITPDNAAVGFCSFCGTEAVLESRISRERRPAHIIPFKKTKENCRDIYMEAISKEPYVPKEFKDPAFIERFRGIYIPYWEYRVGFKNEPLLKVTETYTRGNYNYTNEYEVQPKLSLYEADIPYDASSGFDDELASSIAPFHREKMVPFSPGYLAGLYADTADVDPGLYEKEAIARAQDDALESIESKFENGAKVDITANSEKRIPILGTEMRSLTAELCPVWFLTWRKGDRLAYAVVNGETGKVHAEIPVDIPGFLLRTGIIALILFAVFTFAGTLILPTTMVMIASLAALASQLIYRAEILALRDKERSLNDLGGMTVESDKKLSRMLKLREKRRRGGRLGGMNTWLIINLILMIVITFMVDNAELRAIGCIFFGLVTAVPAWISALIPSLAIKEKTMLIGMTLPLLAQLLCLYTLAAKTADDWKLYAVCAISLGAAALTAVSMLLRYNRLCTRGVPDFHDRKGGARYEAG